MNQRMISGPPYIDPYEVQQGLEMRFCERCEYAEKCIVYGMPYDRKCQDKQDFNNHEGVYEY